MALMSVCSIGLCLLLGLLSINVSAQEYCIIGAGPSGLQMAYFLERAGRDYIIYEKSPAPGWFYTVYPRHRNLISLNKRFTGKQNKEFNLRHDWNSIISDDPDLLMTKYSKEFFPAADVIVQYMKDYAEKLKLKAKYNTFIKNITRNEDDTYNLMDQNSESYTCKYIISATGVWVENIPKKLRGVENTVGYPEMSIDLEDYEGKTVLILGRGNSGFETAQHLLPAANLVHMGSRSRVKFSWETHYVGDLRAINCGPIDTYQLKSLDGQVEVDFDQFELVKHPNGKVYIVPSPVGENKTSVSPSDLSDNIMNGYDYVLRTLGFKYDRSVFDESIRPKPSKQHSKYPEIKPNYEVTTTPNVFVTGTASHSLDFKKSAGGFIHGFRYTTRALARHLEWRNHGVPWPHVTLHITELQNYLMQRINEASDIYQMFSHLVDVIVFRDAVTVEYFQAVGIGMLDDFEGHTGKSFPRGIIINMEYGKNFSGPGADPFKEDRATGDAQQGHTSNFLHPVLYYYNGPIPKLGEKFTLARPDRIHHMVENFLTEWVSSVQHTMPLRWFLEYCAGADLRRFTADKCFKIAMSGIQVPIFCNHGYMNGGVSLSS